MMGPGGWVVGVFLRFQSNGVATMQRLASSTAAANLQLARQTGQIDKNAFAMANYTRKIEAARLAQMRLVTRGAGIGAAVGVGAMVYSMSNAAKLQTAMIGIQNATGASADQMERLRGIAFDVSAQTAQSVVSSANIMKVMATSGINDPNALAKIALPAAKFADVQFLSRGVPFEQGAKEAIQAAHLFQQYGGKGLTSMFDQLTRLSQMMPDDLNRYITQAGYYMPVFRRLGVPDEQSFVAGAFMDRMGLGRGKGGTGLQNFILTQMKALAITGHVQSGQADALGRLGLLNSDGSSKYYSVNRQKYGDDKAHFDVFGSLNAINAAVQKRTAGLHGQALAKAQGQSITDIQRALNVQGGRIGFLGTPEALGQLNAMLKQMPKLPGTDQAQARYMNSLAGQSQLAFTNFTSLMTELGWPWLQSLTNFAHGLGDVFHNAQQWLHGHKDIEKAIGGIFGGVTALLGIRFATGSLFSAGVMGRVLPFVMGWVRIGALALALAGIPVGPVLLIGAVAFGIFEAVTHFNDIVKWWKKNETSLTFAIGFYSRKIIDTAGSAINAVFSGISAAVSAGAANIWRLATGDKAGFQKAITDAMGGVMAPGGHNAFGAGWNAGGLNQNLKQALHQAEQGGVHARGPVRLPKAGNPLGVDPHLWKPSPITINGGVNITLPNVKTAKDAHEIHAALRDPRSMMASAPAGARTHPLLPMVFSVRTA